MLPVLKDHMDLGDKLASEQLKGRVEYWKQIAAIQIHFNDMCIRTRWLGLTAIATLVAAAAIAEKENISLRLPFYWLIGLPSVLMLISLTLLLALWFLDIHYYYKMLIASVEYGEHFEKQIMADLKVEDDGITSYISQKISRRRAGSCRECFISWLAQCCSFFWLAPFFPEGLDGVKNGNAC
jgi:hypothetical protein